MSLIVPFGKSPMPSSSLSNREKFYVIQTGDTLQTVAKKYDMSVATLVKANKKRNTLVKVGERLVIPKN